MFDWTYIDSNGEEVGRSKRFPNLESAEDWIGSSWQDLVEWGVEEVVLHDRERDRRMYKMGLGAE